MNRSLAAALFALAALTVATPASAASAWHKEIGGTLRVSADAPAPDGTATAALHIRMDEGFKTYWRNPGRSGIPPVVSFFGSQNVESAELELPPPHVFRDPNDLSVGYKGEVAFPVRVKVKDASKPYRLQVTGTVGFCADICVPVPFRLSDSSLTPMPPGLKALVEGHRRAVIAPSDDFHVSGVTYDRLARRLHVEAIVPDRDVAYELVVDGPDGLPVKLPPAADAIRQEGTKATFIFDLARDVPLEGHEVTTMLVVARFGLAGRVGVRQTMPVTVVEE